MNCLCALKLGGIMQIRRAKPCDIVAIDALLYQVAQIHADGRPDLFKPASKKYTDEELLQIVACDDAPVFVAVEGEEVLGYAFCIFQRTQNSLLLQDRTTLYIDDLCVDEKTRGKGIGASLYAHVCDFAAKNGAESVTLNVWAFNENAYKFYKKQGMTPQRIVMEKVLTE